MVSEVLILIKFIICNIYLWCLFSIFGSSWKFCPCYLIYHWQQRDQDNAEDAIRRETEEETGFILKDVKKIFEAYMSPGSVTEILYFFIAEYSRDMQTSTGGGVDSEDIEVMELPFEKALAMMETGEIKDGKTIMLLQYLKLHSIL